MACAKNAVLALLLLISATYLPVFPARETVAVNEAGLGVQWWLSYGGDAWHSNYFGSAFEYPRGAIIIGGIPANGSYAISVDFDGDLIDEFVVVREDGKGILVVGKYGVEYNISFSEPVADVAAGYVGLNYLVYVLHGNYLTMLNATFRRDVKLPGTGTRVLHAWNQTPLAVVAVSTAIYAVDVATLKVSLLYDAGESIRYLTGLCAEGPYTDVLMATPHKLVLYSVSSGEVIWSYTHSSELPNVSPVGVMEDGGDFIAYYNGTHVVIVAPVSGMVVAAYPAPEVFAMGSPGYKSVILLNSTGAYFLSPYQSKLICANCDTLPVVVDFGGDGTREYVAMVGGKLSVIYDNGTVRPLQNKSVSGVTSYYLALGYLDEWDVLPEVAVLGMYFESRQKLIIYKLFEYEPEAPSISGPSSPRIAYEVEKYHNYSEIVAVMEELRNAYPDRVTMFSIGKSWWFGGTMTDIYALRITNGTPGKSALAVIGAHHARELITAEAALFFAVNVTESYGSDPLITWLLDHYDVYVVPVLNVGGHDYALSFDVMRGNLRPVDTDGDGSVDEDLPKDLNEDGLIEVYYDYYTYEFVGYEGYDSDEDGFFGEDPYGWVDPNRNYAYDWEPLGPPGSEVYSGPYPLSEPETQAVDSLFRNVTPLLAISLHSGEETVFFPWGVRWRAAPEDVFLNISYAVQEATGFAAIQSSAIYEAPGCWDDHVYGFYGTLAFTFEIFVNTTAFGYTTKTVGGRTVYAWRGFKWYFNPMPGKIRSVCNNVLSGILVAAREAYSLRDDSTPPVIEEVSLRDGELRVKAKDDESGIQYVLVESGGEEIYAKRSLDGTTFTAQVPGGGVTIKVVNRAGIAATRYVGSIRIVLPEEDAWLNTTDVRVAWGAEGDFKEFSVFVNGSVKAKLPGNETSCELKLSEGRWVVSVSGVLGDGTTVFSSVRFWVDVTPPMVSVTSPAYGERIFSREVWVEFSYSDNFGVANVVVFVDGKPHQLELGASSISVALEEGKHQVKVVVLDFAGNIGEASVEFEVVNPAYYATIVATPAIAAATIAYFVVRRRRKRGLLKILGAQGAG